MITTGTNQGADQGSGQKAGRGTGAMDKVARVKQVLLHRDEHVANALALLQELGVLDEPSRKRLWERYRQGDEWTRALLQEQVARVLGTAKAEAGGTPQERTVPPDGASAAAAPHDLDPDEVDLLRQYASKEVDVGQVADHLRRFDPMRLLGDAKDPGRVARFLSEAPLAVHRFQRRLFWGGVGLLVLMAGLVVLAVLVPGTAAWVGLFGVVLLGLFLSVQAVRTSLWIRRGARRQGVDLDAYAQLPDDERRVLLLRRIGLRILDPVPGGRKTQERQQGQQEQQGQQGRPGDAPRKDRPEGSVATAGRRDAPTPAAPWGAARPTDAGVLTDRRLDDAPLDTRGEAAGGKTPCEGGDIQGDKRAGSGGARKKARPVVRKGAAGKGTKKQSPRKAKAKKSAQARKKSRKKPAKRRR